MQTGVAPPAAPEKWNIQQIVEHLLLTYARTIDAFNVRLLRGTPTRAVPSFSQRFGQFYVVTLRRFPVGRHAPETVCPPGTSIRRSGEELRADLHAELLLLDDVAQRAQLMFGGKRAVSHMVLGPMAVESWRRFHLVHGQHHLRQIMAIRAAWKPPGKLPDLNVVIL